MKTLYVLRHAKAERDSASGEDFDRPLTPRGRDDAAKLGVILAGRKSLPSLILTSSSQRTMDTLECLSAGWKQVPPVTALKQLYLAPASRLLDTVRATGGRAERVLIIAHNPGIEELILHLARNIPSEPLSRVRQKVPTCAFATFDVALEVWSDAAADLCHLTDYWTPKNLADRGDA